MTKDEIQLLYEYNRWANNNVLHSVSTLSAEQFTRDLNGGFRSVRDTLVHLFSSEWAWLAVWKQPSPAAAFVDDIWPRRDTLFPTNAFPTAAAVQSQWTEIEQEQIEFVNRVTDESLRALIPVEDTQLSRSQLMQHTVNHSTYHRGQVAIYLRQLSAAPIFTDYVSFLLRRRRAGPVAQP